MFYCLVVGSRTFNNYDLLQAKLDFLLQNKVKGGITIVSGGARGADTLAELYAKKHNYHLKVFPADWNTFGKRAGYIRNEVMHEYISKFKERGVVAFWDYKSKGTAHNFPLAKKYKTPLRIVDIRKGN